jgi:soluble lytic murein transglycosylase
MFRSLAPAIQGRWFKGMSWVHSFGSAAFPAFAIVCLASSVSAQSVSSLGQTYRKDLSPANRAALIRFAAAHTRDASGAQALLVTAAGDLERKAFPEALDAAKDLEKRLPSLADYIAFVRATAQFETRGFDEAVKEASAILRQAPASPLLPRSVMLAARADVELQKPKEAVELLRKHYAVLPLPQADLLLAQSSEALGDPVAAASYYQKVFYLYPSSMEAAQAEAALETLRQTLGEKLPPAMPQSVLGRASRLMNAGDARKAKSELEALIPQVGGLERDQAKVRVGVADYFARDNQLAYRYLKDVSVASPEADAERLYYLHSAARRLKNEDDAMDAVERLSKQYPNSPWRLQGILSVANRYLLSNQGNIYEPLYQACYEAFPRDAEAPNCHWKVAWNEYLKRGPDSTRMLREHLVKFPSSEKAPAALYFLGRAAEKQKSLAAARTYYAEIVGRFPNYFHSVLAREKLAQPAIANAGGSAETEEFLGNLKFPPRATKRSFEPDAPTRVRMERARLLVNAGLDDWAETELRFGAKTDGQSHVLALELAQMAEKRGAHDQAIRTIKSLAGGYLAIPFDAAPDKFWRLAFPMPYRVALEANSKERSLDPFMVAALIRQESEFNPLAVSRAKAYGLTQVLPSTGREISRKLGVRPFAAKMLFQPELNLKLGTYYLRSMFDQLGGQWEATLAAYNAGKSRVDNWLNYAVFEEPAEFIESIPFTETRNYVQIVMRNADVYRRLYGSNQSAVLSTDGLSSKGISTVVR